MAWLIPVTSINETDFLIVKVYISQEDIIQVHQLQVHICVKWNFQLDTIGMEQGEVKTSEMD